MPLNTTSKNWPEAFRVSRFDPRFSFCRHIPEGADASTGLLVTVHGSGRNAMAMRDAFANHPATRSLNILAPLFPVSPFGDNNGDGYKYLLERDLRYDVLLLDMIEEFAEFYPGNFERFHMFGFSGGGHFTHRFAYLHPKKLISASIGAPGRVTLADPSLEWPSGLGGLEAVLGQPADLEGLRKVRVQLLCGDQDTKPMPDRGEATMGRNRLERIATLKESFGSIGIDTRLDIIPGAAHEWAKVAPVAADFIASTRAG